MTAQEFVQYMPADALAATIAHVYENIEPDMGEQVIIVCWAALVAMVGEQEANEMVAYQDLSEVAS